MAIPLDDHLKHLASLDAVDLIEPYRTISAREWDGLADTAWHTAAKDADCDPDDRRARENYLTALVAECRKLADEY